jgi:hypothetical protein
MTEEILTLTLVKLKVLDRSGFIRPSNIKYLLTYHNVFSYYLALSVEINSEPALAGFSSYHRASTGSVLDPHPLNRHIVQQDKQ